MQDCESEATLSCSSEVPGTVGKREEAAPIYKGGRPKLSHNNILSAQLVSAKMPHKPKLTAQLHKGRRGVIQASLCLHKVGQTALGQLPSRYQKRDKLGFLNTREKAPQWVAVVQARLSWAAPMVHQHSVRQAGVSFLRTGCSKVA
jgi:hypothetical protein